MESRVCGAVCPGAWAQVHASCVPPPRLESCVIPAGEWILLARELQGNAHLQTLLLRGGLLELSEAGFVLGPLRRLA